MQIRLSAPLNTMLAVSFWLQVEQLKEEIGVKDLALVKEHFDHMKVGVRGAAGPGSLLHTRCHCRCSFNNKTPLKP